MDFSGLSAWQAATLYVYFIDLDDSENQELLAHHISRGGPATGGFPERWEKLNDAIYRNDYNMIKMLALPPKNGGEAWPPRWAHIGRKVKYMIFITFDE